MLIRILYSFINARESRKFRSISSYFIFQIFQHLFMWPNLWTCRLTVFFEGPSSANILWVHVLGYCSNISSKASSLWHSFVFEASLKMSEPILCNAFVENFWFIHIIYSFAAALAFSSFLQNDFFHHSLPKV